MKNVAIGRVKKSYSLSQEAEQFVRRTRTARKIRSDSEALDQILREAAAVQARAALDAAFTAYYDSASDEELAEETEWAAFAEGELAALSQ